MIVNLTQHAASPDQIAVGVVDLQPELRTELVRLLTVDAAPTAAEIVNRCEAIAALPNHLTGEWTPVDVMIGGAPWMMAALERACFAAGWRALYAFSERVSEEQTLPDGSVKKVNVFKHAGWIEAV